MKNKILTVLCFLLICLCLGACQGKKSTWYKQPETTTSVDNSKDASILAVVTSTDIDNQKISFYRVDIEENYTCFYNAGTIVRTKTGRISTVESLPLGSVVNIEYVPETNTVTTIQISNDKNIWENGKVTNFSVDDTTRSIKVGSSLYYYKDDVCVISNGRCIDVSELTEGDQLVVRGQGERILSIVVDKGHGYISLKGAEIFVGGLVDVGGTTVKVIEDNMLLIVQEGVHRVEVRNGETIAEKYVTVVRDEQCVADFSDIAANVTVTGTVKINVNISNATVYIDNVKRDHSSVITLVSGKHKLEVSADGYVTYTGTIDVGSTHQSIDIKLGVDEEGSSEETTKENETVVSKVNDVTVVGPKGAMVYFDSTYVGIAPVTFDMVTGTHVISILNGTEIKSYTVTLTEGGSDVEYDFTDK